MKLLDELAAASLKKDIPDFGISDTVVVSVKVIEGDKEKTHEFKGVVIARKGRGISETFIIRKLSFGEGIERIFNLHSPMIKSIEVIKKGKVRRAKLYYLRGKIGKKAKVKDLALVPDTSPKTAVGEEKVEQKTE